MKWFVQYFTWRINCLSLGEDIVKEHQCGNHCVHVHIGHPHWQYLLVPLYCIGHVHREKIWTLFFQHQFPWWPVRSVPTPHNTVSSNVASPVIPIPSTRIAWVWVGGSRQCSRCRFDWQIRIGHNNLLATTPEPTMSTTGWPISALFDVVQERVSIMDVATCVPSGCLPSLLEGGTAVRCKDMIK